MRLLDLLFPERRNSAVIAKDRLKIVLAHERASRDAVARISRTFVVHDMKLSNRARSGSRDFVRSIALDAAVARMYDRIDFCCGRQ